jgi:hypothetical protein
MQRHLLPHGTSRPGQIIAEPNATGPVSVLRAVARGKGVAPVIAPLAEHAGRKGVVLLPLNPPLVLPLELAWREPAGPTLRRVIAFLRSEASLAQLPPPSSHSAEHAEGG